MFSTKNYIQIITVFLAKFFNYFNNYILLFSVQFSISFTSEIIFFCFSTVILFISIFQNAISLLNFLLIYFFSGKQSFYRYLNEAW